MLCCIIYVIAFAALCYLLHWLLRYFKISDFRNKFVLITGCDTGFGQTLALRLDGLGFTVFAGCLTKSGEKFLSEKASSRMIPFILDVTSPGSIQKALELVEGKLPQDKGLWAIVNNAGIRGAMASAEMCTLQDFKAVADVNLFGPIEMCRTFLPLVRKCKGRVVNMTSIAGRCAVTPAPYCTSKFALEGYSDRLRMELHPHGVKVSIIEPGFLRTNIMDKESVDKAVRESFNAASDEVKAAYGSTFVQDNIKLFGAIREMVSDDQSPVVDAYIHAITSRFPQTRYVVGLDARISFRQISFLPAGLGDCLLRLNQKIIMSRSKASQTGSR